MSGLNRRSATLPGEPRQRLRADGKIGGFDLPEGVLPKGEEWHPQTREWWDAWRRSPQAAAMATDVDWRYLLDTALLHHQYWKNGRWEFANEIRMREAKLGATPGDRNALKFHLEVLGEHPVGKPLPHREGYVSITDPERLARVLNADPASATKPRRTA